MSKVSTINCNGSDRAVRSSIALAIGVACTLIPRTVVSQGAAGEWIVGRVIADNGQPISQALVSATRAPDRLIANARTDSAGAFSFHFEPGTGDYLIGVNALGYRPFRRRLQRAGTQAKLRIDVILVPAAVVLDAVTVEAPKPAPKRGPELSTEIGALERLNDGVAGALAPDQEGMLGAIASTLPGILSTPDGISVFGLAPTSNNITLNGLDFGGDQIPPEAKFRARVSSSTYDPARGGFSGAQIAVELTPGNQFSYRRGHISMDFPFLQRVSRVRSPNARGFSSVRGGLGADGELVPDKWYYNVAAEFRHRTSETPSWATAGPTALRAAGISADSVEILKNIIAVRGIPSYPQNAETRRIADGASIIARIDKTPFGRNSISAVLYARARRSSGADADFFSSPISSTVNSSFATAVQLAHSSFIGSRALNDFKIGLSSEYLSKTNDSAIPQVRVSLASPMENGVPVIVPLRLGGALPTSEYERVGGAEVRNETQVTVGARGLHRLKMTVGLRASQGDSERASNPWGTYTYESLNAFRDESPTSFARGFPTRAVVDRAWETYVAIGDYWRPLPRVQLLYGVRLDGRINRAKIPSEPDIDAALSVASRNAPKSWHLSPRLGFTWLYGGVNSATPGLILGPAGSQYRPPRGILRGGIGVFRGDIPLRTFEDVLASRAVGTGYISCFRDAIPIPNWSEFGRDRTAIPTDCVAGSATFADSERSFMMFAREYEPPSSSRATLSWLTGVGPLAVGLEGAISVSSNMASVEDVNLPLSSFFTLAAESNRPVYVPEANIIPVSGASVLSNARRVDGFRNIALLKSDQRTINRQVTVSVSPQLRSARFMMTGSYTLAKSKQLARGFDETTGGNPRTMDWMPSMFDVRHHILIQAGVAFRNAATVTAFARAHSGLPFTPRVLGDINGDGYFNDRAFVFEPTALQGANRMAMSSLLSKRNAIARRCLAPQVNLIAAAGGCRTPWSYHLNARIDLPWGALSPTKRLRFSAHISNVLALLDRAANGGDVHGWGSTANVDQVLYRVTGFDPATRSFAYAVNPQFGALARATRIAPPAFQITVVGTLNLGVPLAAQQLSRWLEPGRSGRPGRRLTATEIATRYSRTVPNLFRTILQEADSLLLTDQQSQILELREPFYRKEIETIWAGLGEQLAALPDRFHAAQALELVDAATMAVWETGRAEASFLRNVLSPLQISLLPTTIRVLLTTDRPVHDRLFIGRE